MRFSNRVNWTPANTDNSVDGQAWMPALVDDGVDSVPFGVAQNEKMS